jgi:hypothetical protein
MTPLSTPWCEQISQQNSRHFDESWSSVIWKGQTILTVDVVRRFLFKAKKADIGL